MIWNDIIYALGDFFTWSFGILRFGNNYVNWFFIVFIAACLIGWMVMQQGYNKRAKEEGSIP